jgi:hypothetical protein
MGLTAQPLELRPQASMLAICFGVADEDVCHGRPGVQQQGGARVNVVEVATAVSIMLGTITDRIH